MKLKHSAVAGSYESSDVYVVIEPAESGLNIDIESSVMSQYGKQIRTTVESVLMRLGIEQANVIVNDKGALDCTIKARVETAVLRACEVKKILHGGNNPMIKNRIRRTMIFLNMQRASLVKDAFVYKPDCVIFDLEDAVAESEKDSARIQLYHTLAELDYQGVERWVRINALDSDLLKKISEQLSLVEPKVSGYLKRKKLKMFNW